jgi:sterol desaturase/sphingolipid hydroxylase (fatty acid hydroxylase superfamily)
MGNYSIAVLEHAMDYQGIRDWRVVLFPVYLIFAFLIGLILPGAYVLTELVSLNAAYLYAAGGISGYLFYEIMHFSYHIPRGHWAEKIFLVIPGWKALRHLHVLHHKREKMGEANFNITLPIFDLLLGTLFWQPMSEFENEKR